MSQDTQKVLATGQPAAAKDKKAAKPVDPELDKRHQLEDLIKRRFFYVNAYEIYGGVKGLYDFGPPGAAMMTELQAFWREFFILEENMLQIDTRTMTPEIVFITSGHVAKFEDKMVRDVVTGDCYRADHILEDKIEELLKEPGITEAYALELKTIAARADDFSVEELGEQLRRFKIKAPDTGNDVSDPFPFNLMFATQIGPTGKLKGYLRPETAQGMFYNFPRLLDYNAGKLPFAAAQIGPAFRNEIAPRNGLLRVREFTLAEIEHFVDPRDKRHPKFESVRHFVLPLYPRKNQLGDKVIQKMTIGEAVEKGVVNNQTLGYFLVRDFIFLTRAGVKPEFIRFRQHLANEMAHYASDCWDAEIKSSYGWVECIGNADRACYDLSVHEKASGTRMSAFVPFPEGPRDMEVTTLTPNKGLIGKQFKGDGKKILDFLEKLNDQEQLLNLKNQVEKDGSATIQGLSVPKEMLAFKTEMKKVAGENVQPSVIEPSFGLGRIMYSILEHAYNVREGDEQRAYLSLSPVVAPIKCAILPLMVKDELTVYVSKIEKQLTKRHISCRSDMSGVALGRKYARMDEIGCPFAATIDYDTIKDDTVTLRERDSMQQVRVPIVELSNLLNDLIDDETSWEKVTKKYPIQQVKDV